jgi:hypothetical protein
VSFNLSNITFPNSSTVQKENESMMCLSTV